MTAVLDREGLLADSSLQGADFCRAYSRAVDEWLRHLFEAFVDQSDGVALAAVGGYGRSDLSPMSDIDVVLLHDKNVDIDELASQLWYPVWDAGLKLGHSVRTPKESLTLAATDIDTATSLLDARCLAGDESMVQRLRKSATSQWRRKAKRMLPTLAEQAVQRRAQNGELAFLLEPDLKASSGGLRDGHVFGWLLAAGVDIAGRDQQAVAHAYDMLLSARVELHRATGRVGDVLLLEEQDAVAEALQCRDADALMAGVAEAGRAISWSIEEAWRASSPNRKWRFSVSENAVEPGIGVVDDAVVLLADADLSDPLLTLRVAEVAARHEAALTRATLERLAANQPPLPEPWPTEARVLFERMLLAGHAAISVLESLDHFGLLVKFIPETEPCRSRPQRNAYHRFTVDRHLFEAAAQAARVVDRVDNPGLLVVGALLHDVGKGYPGDHTDVGVEMIPAIAERMGYDPAEVQLLVDMCRHHLLLPDVATRRDIDDPDTIRWVADQVGSVRLLQLLDGLTEADSIATGPAAWSRWKASLVADLVRKTHSMLESGDIEIVPTTFPTAAQRELMASRKRQVVVDKESVTVVIPDAPGLLWRVAGTLALHGLHVMKADVHSEDGMALHVYRVDSIFGSFDADALTHDIWSALEGRLAVFARLADRVRIYESGPRKRSPQPVVATKVSFDNQSSSTATVIEVSATDSLGLLCRMANALTQQRLYITRSKVQTLGEQAVDSFYVHDLDGYKITDPEYLDEIRRAVLHGLEMQERR